jgi:hypothetical protein
MLRVSCHPRARVTSVWDKRKCKVRAVKKSVRGWSESLCILMQRNTGKVMV